MRLIYLIIALLIATPSFAVTYHIDETYGSGGDGSFATPFDELNDLPSMSTGDDVYLKCGSVFTPTAQWLINWGGTSGNRAIIGSYYDSGGTPVYDTNGTEPIIDGSNWTEPSNCLADDYNHLTDCYGGLVSIAQQMDYVTVENIEIRYAGGYGLHIDGDGTVANNVAYFIFDNVKSHHNWRSGIMVQDNPENYGIIQNCETSYNSESYGSYDYTPWSYSINIAHSAYSYATVKDNYAHHNYGEGIGAFANNTLHAGYVTFQDNISYDNRKYAFYADGTRNNVFKRNIAIESPTGFYGSTVCFAMDTEVYRSSVSSRAQTINNTFENNICIGGSVGLYWGIASERSVNHPNTGNNFFNNTIIAASQGFYIGSHLNGTDISNTEIKDNIIYCPTGESCSNIGNRLKLAYCCRLHS
jgi:hypothetical protein